MRLLDYVVYLYIHHTHVQLLIHLDTYVYVYVVCIHNIMYVHCLYAGALSVTDSDDDYCVSYTVTMVDVRSCTRPPRSLGQDHHPSMCMYRSGYIVLHTYINANSCIL